MVAAYKFAVKNSFAFFVYTKTYKDFKWYLLYTTIKAKTENTYINNDNNTKNENIQKLNFLVAEKKICFPSPELLSEY